MTDLLLHNKKGVNPRLTVCCRCGKDVGIALLGAHEGLWECPHKVSSIGGRPKVVKDELECGCTPRDFHKVRDLDEHEKLAIEICDECVKLQRAADAEVKRGGIYWHCSSCGSAGAIKAEHPMSKDVRAHMKIAPPNPCGVEFSKNECPQCGPKA